MILLACIPLGILIGWILGGRIRNLGELPLRGWPLLVLPCLFEYAGGILDINHRLSSIGQIILIVAAYGMLVIGIWLNRKITGLAVLAGGFFLNLIVVCSNGFRMPFSKEGAIRAGFDLSKFPSSFKPITGHTHFPFLADIFPIPHWGFHPSELISVGDMIIMVGILLVVSYGMKRNPTVKFK